MKELITELDVEDEECNCVSNKFKQKDHLIDNNARMDIKKT